MAGFTKFEEIEAWKKARELCKLIFDLTKKEKFSKDFSLKDQIRRSSGSIMDNIAEGFERGGKKNLFSFYIFLNHLLLKPNLNYTEP